MKMLIIVLGLAFANVALAKELPKIVISMQAKQMGARDMLEHLLQDSGLKYDFAPAITNSKKVSIEAKQAKWDELFISIIEQANLKYTFDANGKLHITKL